MTTTVRPGAIKVSSRRAPTGPTAQAAPIDNSNGMGGIFGEAEQEARGLNVDALGLARTAAAGNAPSAAEILGNQGLDRAAADQQSLAASARGPAALAMAQQQAAYNTANLQQQGSAQMAGMRAQEMDSAREQYLQGTGLMRSQDMSRYNSELQRGMGRAGLEAGNQEGRAKWDETKANIGKGMVDTGFAVGKNVYLGNVASHQADQNQLNAMYASQAEEARRRAANKAGVFKGIMGTLPGAASTVAGVLGGGAGSTGGVGGASGMSGGEKAGSGNAAMSNEVNKSMNNNSQINWQQGSGTSSSNANSSF